LPQNWQQSTAVPTNVTTSLLGLRTEENLSGKKPTVELRQMVAAWRKKSPLQKNENFSQWGHEKSLAD